jgi:precorrin-2 dehydrogenase/sirohydrochlorin ferrochelatase
MATPELAGSAAPAVYPVALLVAGRPCLVVGGGPVAAEKAAGLLACGALVHVIAAEAGPELRAIAGLAGLTIDRRPYRPGEAASFRLVVAATGDPAANRVIYEDAEAAGIWVNSADDPEHCSVFLPAVLRRGPLTVAISTGGASPAFASWLRRRFEAEIGPEYEVLLSLLTETRAMMKATGRAPGALDWQKALDSDMLELIRSGQISQAKERLQACLSSS